MNTRNLRLDAFRSRVSGRALAVAGALKGDDDFVLLTAGVTLGAVVIQKDATNTKRRYVVFDEASAVPEGAWNALGHGGGVAFGPAS